MIAVTCTAAINSEVSLKKWPPNRIILSNYIHYHKKLKTEQRKCPLPCHAFMA